MAAFAISNWIQRRKFAFREHGSRLEDHGQPARRDDALPAVTLQERLIARHSGDMRGDHIRMVPIAGVDHGRIT